jgi:hypothetical protein
MERYVAVGDSPDRQALRSQPGEILPPGIVSVQYFRAHGSQSPAQAANRAKLSRIEARQGQDGDSLISRLCFEWRAVVAGEPLLVPAIA